MKKIKLGMVSMFILMTCLQVPKIMATDEIIKHDFIESISNDKRTNEITLHINDELTRISKVVLPNEEVVEHTNDIEYIATENKDYQFKVYYHDINADGSIDEEEKIEVLSYAVENLVIDITDDKDLEPKKDIEFADSDYIYYVSNLGNDENDGKQQSTPKKSIIEILENSEVGSNVKIYILDNLNGEPKILIPKNLGSVLIESIDGNTKIIGNIYANGVPVTLENITISMFYGGGYEEDTIGDTHIILKGANSRVATAIGGGGEVTPEGIKQNKTATIYGNTKVEIKDKATTGHYITGGGFLADVTGNVDIFVDANPDSYESKFYGATRVQTIGAKDVVSNNTVGGNVRAVIKDGNFDVITGNTAMLIHDSNSGQYATSNVTGNIDLTFDGGKTRVLAGNTHSNLFIGNFLPAYNKIQRLDSNVGSVNLNINGGSIRYNIYTGSWIENGKHVITGDTSLNINAQTNDIFNPVITHGGDHITNTSGRHAPELLEADIQGNINVNIHGGRFGNIYYGSTYAGGTHIFENGATGSVAVPGYSKVHGNIVFNMDDASGTKPSLDGIKNTSMGINREQIAMTAPLSGVNTIVQGNVTTNIKNVEKAYLINGGFQENGQISGKITMNLENITGVQRLEHNTVAYVFGSGRQNGVNGTSIKTHVDGGIEVNIKNMNIFQTILGLSGGGLLNNQDSENNAVKATIENSHITHLFTNGSNVYTQQDRELITNGNANITISGENSMIGRLVTGSSIGKSATSVFNGDVNVEIQTGLLSAIEMGHVGNEAKLAGQEGDINVTIRKDAVFKPLTTELCKADFSQTYISTMSTPKEINGQRSMTLESAQKIDKLNLAEQIDVYNFIHLDEADIPTLSIKGITTLSNSSKQKSKGYNAIVNLSGSWDAEDIIITTPTGISEEHWFVQGWKTENPAMGYRLLNGTGGEWYLKESYTDSVVVKFESNGGTPINSQSSAIGELVKKPIDPTKAGHKFKGWYMEDSCENLWDYENQKILGSMTLYAKWEKVAEDDKPEEPEKEKPSTEDTKTEEPNEKAPNEKLAETMQKASISTGDTNNLVPLFASLGISTLGVLVAMITHFRKSNKRD